MNQAMECISALESSAYDDQDRPTCGFTTTKIGTVCYQY
jgi:hypothetical protein